MPVNSGSGDTVAVLQRWEDSGAIWRVVRRDRDAVEIALITCTGDEEVDRVSGSGPDLLIYVGDRWSSEQ